MNFTAQIGWIFRLSIRAHKTDKKLSTLRLLGCVDFKTYFLVAYASVASNTHMFIYGVLLDPGRD